MKLTTKNSKLGGFILQMNLPAILTCRADAPCKKGCYATKGNYIYSKVKKGYMNNLTEYLDNKEQFFSDIIEYLNNDEIIYKYFRWHSSGEIVDYNYLLGMIRVAKACKLTKFLCYTKKFNLVNSYLALGHKIPKNLIIVFSGWDKDFKVNNPFNLPQAYIRFKKKEINANIPDSSIPCSSKCKNCKVCWNLKENESVVFKFH